MRAFLLCCVLAAPAAVADVDSFSAKLIDRQILELETAKVSMAGPVTTLALGGAALGFGLFTMATASTQFVFFLYLGLTATLVAIVPIAMGIVWLCANVIANERIDVAVRRLRDPQAADGLVPLVSF